MVPYLNYKQIHFEEKNYYESSVIKIILKLFKVQQKGLLRLKCYSHGVLVYFGWFWLVKMVFSTFSIQSGVDWWWWGWSFMIRWLGMSLSTNNAVFFSIVQNALDPSPPSFWTFGRFFWRLGGTLHCSEIGKYKT